MKAKYKILIVDDEPRTAKLLATRLACDQYEIIIVHNGEVSLQKISQESFDLILLDIMMPGLSGFEVCRQITQNPITSAIPILFITSLDGSEHKRKGFEAGAVDYINKPFDACEVKARVKTHLALKAAQDALKNENHILDGKVKLRTAELAQANKSLHCEISSRIKVHEALQASEAKNRAILKAMPDQVIQFNREGLILNCLGSGEGFPFDPLQIIGQKIDQVLTPELAQRAMQQIQATLQSGEFENCECQLPLDEGIRHYEFRMVRIAPDEVLAIARDITEKKQAEEALREREARLRDENLRLKSSMKERYRLGNIIGKSRPMQAVYDLIVEAAETDAGVIIYGESGTGKELVARAIHDMSHRRDKVFVPVNSGAIPETLLESEFFGYQKGAFSDAKTDKHGFLSLAENGTLFLDEIGEISLNMQVKLLRAIEGSGYTPVGSNQVRKTDLRIVAATNRDLMQLVKEGLLREDFFYRIHIIPIHLPPLRERKEDLPLLIDHILKKIRKNHNNIPPITGKVIDALNNYGWPGNVRELQNTIQRYVTLKSLDFMGAHAHTWGDTEEIRGETTTLEPLDYRASMEHYEKKIILRALENNQWHREKTAACLGLPRRTFFRKLKNFQLNPA